MRPAFQLGEALAIVAFVHALGLWFEQNQSWLEEMPRPGSWRLRENKWRAMRYGLDAQMVCNNLGETAAIADDIKKWLDRIESQYETLNYQTYRKTLLDMIARGNSAKRQQTVWALTNSIEEVTRFNCRELQTGMPLWSYVDELKSRPVFAEEPAKTAS